MKIETTNYPIKTNSDKVAHSLSGYVYEIILKEGDKCRFPLLSVDPVLIDNEPYDVTREGDNFRISLPVDIKHSISSDPDTGKYVLTIGNEREI